MGGRGPRKERRAGTIFLPPAAAQTLGGWAPSPSCVFVFISPFSTLPRSRRALPLLPRPVWPRLSPPCCPARSTSAGLLWCIGRRASHYPRRSTRREALQRRRRPAAGLAPLPAAGEAGVEGAARSPANPRGPPGGGRAAGGWTCPAGRRGRSQGCRGAALAAAQVGRRRSPAGGGSRGISLPPKQGTLKVVPRTSSASPGSERTDRAQRSWGGLVGFPAPHPLAAAL